jgi:hypothetical protein
MDRRTYARQTQRIVRQEERGGLRTPVPVDCVLSAVRQEQKHNTAWQHHGYFLRQPKRRRIEQPEEPSLPGDLSSAHSCANAHSPYERHFHLPGGRTPADVRGLSPLLQDACARGKAVHRTPRGEAQVSRCKPSAFARRYSAGLALLKSTARHVDGRQ